MKASGVYMIQSIKFPERIYVGSAEDLWSRMSHHKRELANNKHPNVILQHHYNKYGEDDLCFDVIEGGRYLDKNHLLSREQMWFDKYRVKSRELPYFNIAPVAGSSKGRIMTEETKIKMRNLKQSEETRRKNSEKNKGHIVTEETKNKISLKQSEPVYQFTCDGIFIKEWVSATFASKVLGINRPGITNCCLNKIFSAGNFVWVYKKNMPIIKNLTKQELGNIGRVKQQKAISQFTIDGLFIRDWDFLRQASRSLSINECYIGLCCRGKAKTAGGFKWKYKT